MCHSNKIEKDIKLAQIRARDNINVLELKDIFLETLEHEDWQPGFNMLCDYSNIENFYVATKDIDDIYRMAGLY